MRHVRSRPRGLDAVSASSPGCEGHAGVPAELRALALAALDRIEPALDRLRIEPPTPTSATCAVCPVCALLAALRGEHPELLQRLAEHAGGLVTALRQAMAELRHPDRRIVHELWARLPPEPIANAGEDASADAAGDPEAAAAGGSDGRTSAWSGARRAAGWEPRR